MDPGTRGAAQERYDRMLLLGARTVFAVIPAYFLVSLIFLDQPSYLYWALGIAWLLSGGGVFAVVRQKRHLARVLVLAAILEAVSCLILFAGPHSNHVSAIFPAVVGSALLLSMRATIATTAWFCIVFGLALVLDGQGFYGESPEFDPVSIYAQLIAVCAFLVSVLHTYQRALQKLSHQREELTRHEEEAAALVESSPDGIALVNEDRTIRTLNPALSELLRGTEIGPGADVLGLAAEDEGVLALTRLVTMGKGSAEFRLSAGAIVSVNAQRLSAQRLQRCVQLTLRDVTREHEEYEKRIELERRLRQSEKMEAFGQFAGGVAHDFNNLLTAVMGHAEFVRRSLRRQGSDDGEAEASLDQLLETAERGADITRGLLSFSRTDGGAAEVIQVSETLSGFEPTLRRLLPEDIELEWSCQAGLYCELPLRAIEQVVMNLTTNSRDAMVGGGKVVFSCEAVSLNEPLATETGVLAPGDYVRLLVSDTGVGMSSEVRMRVFEPFFSTRGPGGGTGLGLSTVHGIVVRAKGGITVQSSEGTGSTVAVYLPRHLTVERETRSEPPPESAPSGTEHILVCEDERAILSVVRRTLELYGYTVFGFHDPAQALEAVRAGSVRPKLLLTDVVMPGMNGRLLSERVHQHIEDLPVLFMSGHTDGILESRGVNRQHFTLLEKPFTTEQLLFKVRQSLDHGAPISSSS